MNAFAKSFAVATAMAIAGLTTTQSASASSDQITYRQTTMKALGAHMGAISAVVRGKVDDGAGLAHQAAALAATAKAVSGVFPESSASGNTDALPVIWEKPEDFAEAVQAMIVASENLAGAAQGGDMNTLRSAFGGVGRTCSGCHKVFRKPK